MYLKQLEKFHQTPTGYIVFGLAELVLSYLFIRLAINSGSWWQWALTGVLLIGVAQNFGRFVSGVVRGR